MFAFPKLLVLGGLSLSCAEDVDVQGQTVTPIALGLRADSQAVSVSGISSGADSESHSLNVQTRALTHLWLSVAVQLQVALSRTFMGVGVFAGQAYRTFFI